MDLTTVIATFLEFFLKFLPRRGFVKATEAAIIHQSSTFKKCNRDGSTFKGAFWFWPYWTEIDVVDVSMQPLNFYTSYFTTTDGDNLEIAFNGTIHVFDPLRLITSCERESHEIAQIEVDLAVGEWRKGKSTKEVREDIQCGNGVFADMAKERLSFYGITVKDLQPVNDIKHDVSLKHSGIAAS